MVAPLVALLLGALATSLFGGQLRGDPRRVGSMTAALALFLAVVELASVLRSPDQRLILALGSLPGSLLLPAPQLEVAALEVSAILAVIFLAWLSMVSQWPIRHADVAYHLAIAAAASLLIAGYRTPFGLVYGWLALDLVLLLGPGGNRRALLMSQVGLLVAIAALAAATASQVPRAIPAQLAAASLSPLLLILAASVRIGLYPFGAALPYWPQGDVRALPAQRLIPLLAGIGLFLSVTMGLHPGEGWLPAVRALCLVAIVGGALLSWLNDHRYLAVGWQLASQAGLATLAAAFGGSMGAAMALLLALDLVLARAALCSTDGAEPTAWVRIARWLASASTIGLPPTLGFVARWLLYRQLLAADLWPDLVAIMVGSAFSTASLLVHDRPFLGRPLVARPVSRWTVAAAMIASSSTLVLGLWFRPLEALGRALVGFSPPSALLDLVYTLRSPLTLASSAALLVAILAPSAVAPLLRQARPQPSTDMVARPWRRLRALVALDGLFDGFGAALHAVGTALQRAAGFASPRRAMAWTLLSVFVITALMLLTGFPGTAQDGSLLQTPSASTLAYLLVATMVIGLVASQPRPQASLSGLAASQLLAAGWLVVAGGLSQATLPLIGIIYGLIGLLAVGILALSLSATPEAAAVPARIPRLRWQQLEPSGDGQRWLAIISLLIVLILVSSSQLPDLSEVIPPDSLRPALLYAVGGAMVVIFAATALQLVVGVLLTWTGFQLGYAYLDPGLLITFSLSSFQLLFALVAAYYLAIIVSVEGQGRS